MRKAKKAVKKSARSSASKGVKKGTKGTTKKVSAKKAGVKKNVPVKKADPKAKRGWPKGSKNKPKYPDLSEVKTGKFLGYCPKCKSMLNSNDLVSKLIFVCYSCGTRARIKTLLEDMNQEKPKSKKEYLSECTSADYHDMPSFNDRPQNLKVNWD